MSLLCEGEGERRTGRDKLESDTRLFLGLVRADWI